MREMFALADSQTVKDRVPEKKRKWRTTRCPNGHKIEYVPKENFTGDLRCPTCGKSFHLVRLDDFKEKK